MIDFTLTEDQLSLQEVARKFAEKEVKPKAAEIDRMADPRQAFDAEATRKACALGFHAMLVPEKWGGLGLTMNDFIIVIEELAAADIGFAMNLAVSCSVSKMIADNGTEAQAERWLRPYCDMRGDTHHLVAFGGTEPSGGTEIFCGDPDPRLGTRTTARADGGDYIINGAKCFITNTSRAELYGVLARTDKTKNNLVANSVFFFTPDTPGFSIGKIEDKMGHRGMSNGELIFDNMRLAKDDMIGAAGEGLPILMRCYHVNGVMTGALSIGLARAAYEMALNYARERVIWGQPIIGYQAISHLLVDMKMQIEAARLLTQRIAWATQYGIHDKGIHPAMGKVFASEMARKVTTDALQILGGSGYMKGFPAEKYVRDSMVTTIYDGANQVLRNFMAMDMFRTA
ncbi:MAG: acyl-CoA dehydrogenase family protein [Azonexus sp.]|jgi:alkylation response protein AidB-like acyl-CoA dehydrogenase|nr:acyl-CoA dehydrogenase family protein [Azonexus sp.]